MSGRDMPIQEAMDRFLLFWRAEGRKNFHETERCIDLFAQYLIHFSDLFREEVAEEQSPMAEWEEALSSYVEQLFEGDIESVSELGSLLMSQLDPEHIRDFMGWFLLREPGVDSLYVQANATVLKQWVSFLSRRHWLTKERKLDFVSAICEMEEEAVRAVRAARLLFHHVRLGSGVAPRFRKMRFAEFVEGHARVEEIRENGLWLRFDNREEHLGPVMLPAGIIEYLQPGDVLDIELGMRGEMWQIVDIGPVYPREVYVEAEEFKVPEKVM